MIHQLEAMYENDGVLRLAHPLPLANRQLVHVTVSDSPAVPGKWAAVDLKSGQILVYADSGKQARDEARALGRGEPMIRWISGEPELPSAGF